MDAVIGASIETRLIGILGSNHSRSIRSIGWYIHQQEAHPSSHMPPLTFPCAPTRTRTTSSAAWEGGGLLGRL